MQLTELEKEHAGIVRGMLSECMVLLKSNGDFPLDGPCEIALYGNGARRTQRGGTGSGEVYSHFTISVEKGLQRAGFIVTSYDWLDAYDLEAQKQRERFVKQIRQQAKEKHNNPVFEAMGAVMAEPDYDLPLDAEGNVAVYVLSRVCGEGNDRIAEKGDILLTDTERRDIIALYHKYDKFMLVLNVGGPVDLSPVMEVENILLLSQLGAMTGSGFADVLLGKRSPSGKLATTWTAWRDQPELFEFGDADDTRYREGIYVGYRYFDTMGIKPLFPFGYGLSYTTFETKVEKTTLEGEQVTVEVTVENTGKYNGKEVVQIYVTIPWGKLDQPRQVLAGWAKTKRLAPGEKRVSRITFAMSELASYDAGNAQYVLEKGDYLLRMGCSSADTEVFAAVTLNEKVVTCCARHALGSVDFMDFCPLQPAKEEIDEALIAHFVLEKDAITTREVNYQSEPEIDPLVHSFTDEELISLGIGAFEDKKKGLRVIGNAGRMVAGAAGETTGRLREKGVPALSMADGPAGVRISKKYWVDEDGAHTVGDTMLEGLSDFMTGPAAFFEKIRNHRHVPRGAEIRSQYATAIPIGTALAQSWNLKVAERCGDIVGREMEEFGVQLWLAPAMNIQRNIRCGRNFEYYSEDPLITGKIAAAITKGVQKHPGCGVTLKHFTGNNQEYNRFYNNSIVSERTMREIYLKGFEICIREADPVAIMSSYNLLNGVHTSERRDLLEYVLRCEFGYRGIVMTDWVIPGVPNLGTAHPGARPSRVARAGGEIFMPGSSADYEEMLTALKKGKLTRKQLLINATRLIRMIRRITV